MHHLQNKIILQRKKEMKHDHSVSKLSPTIKCACTQSRNAIWHINHMVFELLPNEELLNPVLEKCTPSPQFYS